MGVFDKIGPGEKAPEIVNVVVEIPMNSGIKYEIDKETGLLTVDRVLFTSMVYPFNYGFIPGTLEEDGDPVDVLIIMNDPILPGSVIRVRPIGALETEDEKGRDIKIIAVPYEKIDARFENVKDIDDIPVPLKERIAHFFEHYKELEKGKWVKVLGWKKREEALNRIRDAIDRAKRMK
ncbi:inorganic diphosphatase [Thermogladius sp. 4427co]|uniref:inorganic diphosphatase n=1 Tax=Thermogladius sp. 4427co TaxID=3450718 RepID=UPI003F7964AE